MSKNTEDSDVILTTQTEVPVAPPPVESSWLGLMPMLLILVMFYILLIRPQEKKRREHESFVASVKKGEEVVTSAGVFGVVTKINDSTDTVLLKIAKDVEIKIQKNSISDIVSRRDKIEKKQDKPKPEKK